MSLEDYEKYYNEYTNLYGSRTVILYKIGKFYEILGIDNGLQKIGNVTEVAYLLGLQETRRNTNILEQSKDNPQLAGFPEVSLDSKMDKLVDHGYTVVVVDQVPDTKPIQRVVSTVVSPSTNMNTTSHRDPYLVSVFIHQEFNKKAQRMFHYIGMSAVDLTTGNNYIFESFSTPSDPTFATDELLRFLQTFTPVEIVINHNCVCTIDDLTTSWGCNYTNIYKNTCAAAKLPDTLTKQEAHLAKWFKSSASVSAKPGYKSLVQALGLERYEMARVAYILMLQFCENHNSKLLKDIAGPIVWQSETNLILDTSSTLQLNIMENYRDQVRQSSVYSMLSHYVSTPMGRRLLRQRLTCPVVDPRTLEERYDYIERMRSKTNQTLIKEQGESVALVIKEYLTGLADLDRLHRRTNIGILTPKNLFALHLSYKKILELFAFLERTGYGLPLPLKELAEVVCLYESAVDMSRAASCATTEETDFSIFQPGFNAEVDRISADIESCTGAIEQICQAMSALIAGTSTSTGNNYFRYRDNISEKEDFVVSLTKPQYKKLESAFTSPLTVTCGDCKYQISLSDLRADTRNKSNVKLHLEVLRTISEKKLEYIKELRLVSTRLFKALQDNLSQHNKTLNKVSSGVAQVDLYRMMATYATQYGYCKPQIAENGQRSYLHAMGLRHPLVERHNVYVPQNIALDTSCTGMLLYGVNQSGKSCTMKSVGIAVILAQAGLYVPAEQFCFWPYKQLMTRIVGSDNLDMGLSTFAVEMTELRSILTRADRYSLVLGDEVCHGTESASAVSIVAASLIHLSAVESSFMFATHLHELSKMSEITELHNVSQFHLTVSFDDRDTIIYNRVLREGAGQGQYGVEVAKHLKLPAKVIQTAYEIRDKYFSLRGDGRAQVKESLYNKNIMLSVCKVPDCNEEAVETHHIMEQSTADKSGLIDGRIHKNNAENLAPLCEGHHHMVHHGRQTADGGKEELVILGKNPDGSLRVSMRRWLESLHRMQSATTKHT